MTQFFDKSVLAGVSRRESDGALIADVRIARTGIQNYHASEVDPENEHGLRGKMVRIYRPGSEVFSEDTMKSAAHRPVTNDHPSELVTADNWKKVAVGHTADEIKGEGIYLRVPLMVSDGAAIKDIENGKREVSSGYTSVLDWTPGTTTDGESYDAVQREIRINHVAIVQRGRAGSAVRIGDEAAWGVSPVMDDERTNIMANKTVTVDGISIEVTDQGAQVIEKLQRQLNDATNSSAKVLADHAVALADKDKQLAAKDVEIEGLKAKVLDTAAVDKLVAERADLVTKAKRVHKDAKVDGLDPAAIRRSAVSLVLGDAAVKDKSDAYVEARFDVLLEGAGKTTDPVREAIRDGVSVADADDPRAKAYAKMVADMSKPTAQAN